MGSESAETLPIRQVGKGFARSANRREVLKEALYNRRGREKQGPASSRRQILDGRQEGPCLRKEERVHDKQVQRRRHQLLDPLKKREAVSGSRSASRWLSWYHRPPGGDYCFLEINVKASTPA